VAFATLAALLVLTGWLLFPKYMAYRERVAIEPRIKEIRLKTHRMDVEELFGPHAPLVPRRPILPATIFAYCCERSAISGTVSSRRVGSQDRRILPAPYEPVFVKVVPAWKPPPRDYPPPNGMGSCDYGAILPCLRRK